MFSSQFFSQAQFFCFTSTSHASPLWEQNFLFLFPHKAQKDFKLRRVLYKKIKFFILNRRVLRAVEV